MNRRGTHVFLAEALVMTIVLSAALTVCLSVFSRASDMKREARELTEASNLVYSAAQCYLSTGSEEETVKLMEKCPRSEGMVLKMEHKPNFIMISASKNGRVIFSSPVKVGIQ